MNWAQLALTLAPELIILGKNLAAIFKSHPELTPEQIMAFVTSVHARNAETLAIIEADQAAHPPTP